MNFRAAAVVFLTTWAAVPALGQQNLSEVEIKVHRVAGNVYYLEGAGGNIGVAVGQDGVLMIDDQYAPLAPKIERALATITDKPLRWVLNTHWHGDHTGGNEAFGKSAPIIAHHNVRERLAAGSSVPGRTVAPAPDAALPVLTFGKDLTIHFDQQEIRAIHFPHAHTDGDAVVFFPDSNVVHTGDLFFAERFPFVDIDSGGSVSGLIRGVLRIVADVPPDATIIPGHGPVSTVGDLEAYASMLRATRTVVARAIQEDLSLEEAKTRKILAPWDNWSWNFITTDRWLETLYRDLSD